MEFIKREGNGYRVKRNVKLEDVINLLGDFIHDYDDHKEIKGDSLFVYLQSQRNYILLDIEHREILEIKNDGCEIYITTKIFREQLERSISNRIIKMNLL